MVDQRTATSETYRNPDGSTTLKEFAGPVHVKKGGEWVDIDYGLVKQADGSYAPKAAPADVSVSGGGTKQATEVTFDDDKTLSLSWPTTLPAPSIDGGVATYKVSDSTDLIVAMTGTGVSTRIRLNKAPAADDPTWTLSLRADGIDVEQTAPDKLNFTNGDTTVGTTTAMVAWDGNTDAAGDPTNIVPVTAELATTATSGDTSRHSLELSTPSNFLDDPSTEYPVIIDPDINAVSGGKSTWMRKDTPASTTNAAGQYHRLLVGRVPGATNTNHAMSYLGWSNSQIAGKPITSAELGVYQYDAGACAARTLMAHPLTGNFTVNTEYDNRPDVNINTGDSVSTTSNPGSDNAGCTSANNWVKLNVTEMAKAWAAGTYTNYGVRLNVPSDSLSDASYSRRLCSSKPDSSQGTCSTASTIPYLKISWNHAPTISAVSTTTCVDCGRVPTITSATPAIDARPTDPDGGTIRTDFELWEGTAATPTTRLATTSINATSGTIARWTPAAQANGLYSVRARSFDGTVYSAWSGWKRLDVNPYLLQVSQAFKRAALGQATTADKDLVRGTEFEEYFPGGAEVTEAEDIPDPDEVEESNAAELGMDLDEVCDPLVSDTCLSGDVEETDPDGGTTPATTGTAASSSRTSMSAQAATISKCTAGHRARRYTVTLTRKSLPGLKPLYKFRHRVHYCTNAGKVTKIRGRFNMLLEVDSTMVDHGTNANSLVVGSTSGTSLYGRRVEMCILKAGCVGNFYPYSELKFNGSGGKKYSGKA